jgi:hypothetical protein
LDPKQLACLDEEQLIEIACPKDGSGDLIITISVTRTCMFTDLPLAFGDNGSQDEELKALHAFVL